jgi:hypothetical protein
MLYTSQAKAKQEAGGVSSRNSKMPGSSWAISPSKCGVGSKLTAVKGSVCHKCYAMKSEAMYPSVKQGWGENYLKATSMIANHPERWAQAMAFQVKHQAKKNAEPYHRWFDAGDLQSVEMLRAIVLVCELTPDVMHWIPTRESKIVADWRKAGGVEPRNLVIRISSTMIDDKPRNAPNTSTVHSKNSKLYVGHACPSSSKRHRASNGGKPSCFDCRACWDKSVPNVSYPLH